jgi:LysM repeat protein
MILQYLYVASKHIEIYIKSKPRKIVCILRGRPKLLLAAVILFGCFWSVFGPVVGFEKLVFGYSHDDKLIVREGSSDERDSIEFQAPYLAVNSSGILATQIEPVDESGGIEEELSLPHLQENALLAQASPITFISQEPRTSIITYVVQPGDTPSTIAASFGITTNTLLWANKLKDGSIIRPGDELVILPVSGVLHKVKSGQTISWIANYYKADANEIIAFNDLPADGQIEAGQQVVVPNGVMPAPPRPKPRRLATETITGPGTGKSHNFPYGQCTWYVAQKRYVPWSGHAKSWLANARAYGFTTGSTPRVGAIIVTRETWYGHVGYVEAVKGNWVTFSEMNHLGWAIKSVRTLHINDPKIRGYIY